ncbi:RNA 2',3'-cyclic phosphodiesterase [Actinocorallia sp. API 0066]|uniref:RNA 2',3'-cyclic phosphodiesterase n=1 Tax=Actinocorallia sp. API 0066 TaxID=2896846 RepID=UPI001E3F7862|nr:RNA 2',3'-cyclic phosphodiesterase [Actinocorallia sp. API 0066]MCD0447686.1 RNA 2',3'-cyclic phosphodiesterase [Actinocorallia sp. API 0066]
MLPTRLYAALRPPDAALAELDAALRPVRAAHPGPRWTARASWHLTLAFYGDVPDEAAAALPALLAEAASDTPPLRLAFTGSGSFPARNPRVLWTGLHGDLAPLTSLAGACADAGSRLGLPTPDRPFQPHLTLARTRTPGDLTTPAALLHPLTGTPWTTAAFTLVHSHFPHPGTTPLHTFPLTAPPDGEG